MARGCGARFGDAAPERAAALGAYLAKGLAEEKEELRGALAGLGASVEKKAEARRALVELTLKVMARDAAVTEDRLRTPLLSTFFKE